jgi:hypothetical protein
MIGVKAYRIPSAEEWIDQSLLYAKLFSLFIVYRYKAWGLLALFCVVWFVLFVVLPLPGYPGKSRVERLSAQDLEEAIAGKGKWTAEVWIVHFGAAWSPMSQYFQVTFARLSNAYGSDRVRFGYVNVDSQIAAAEKHHVTTDASAFRIPTVIMYRKGKETGRLPGRGNVAQVTWTRTLESVVEAFQLTEPE